MKSYLSGKDYAPTMVANGSKRHPLRSHYSRLHSNPEDIEVDLDDMGDAVAVSSKSVKAEKVKGQRGRKPMSDSAKARAKAERDAGKSPKSSSTKKVSEAAQIRRQIAEMLGNLVKASKTPVAEKSESAKKAKEERKAKEKKKVDGLKAKIKELREVKGLTLPKRFPALKIQPDLEELMALLKAKKSAAKVSSGEGGRGRKPMSASAKARAKAERDARSASTVAALKAARKAKLKKNPGAEPSKVGPYKITLLKNPITDFEIGGVKVLPAVAGAAGAVALIQLVSNIPFVAKMEEGYLKRILPGAVTVALGAAGLYFADKNKSAGMLKDLSKDIAAFGMFAAVNGAVGVTINESVNKLMAPSAPAAPKLNGGAHFSELSGGGWAGQEVPQLDGYHMSGANSGYPAPFSMNGETGYFVPANLGLNGYHMSGDANSAATAAALSVLNGGMASHAAPLGGHDLNGYQD